MPEEPMNATWKDINSFINEVKPNAFVRFAFNVAEQQDRDLKRGVKTLRVFELRYLNHIQYLDINGFKVRALKLMCNN